MANRYNIRIFLGKQLVKLATIVSSVICGITTVVTWLFGEEPLNALILFVITLIFVLLRLVAED